MSNYQFVSGLTDRHTEDNDNQVNICTSKIAYSVASP